MNALILLILIILISPASRGALSEPPNILYGAISLNNQPITAARTDVVVQARRSLNGPAIASYRMGSDPAAGDFYSLRIPVEILGVPNSPAAAQAGENLYIVATDSAGRRQDATYSMGERSAVQRLDLGPLRLDTDADFLPDAWEMLYFGNLNQNWLTLAPNGKSAWDNYQTGANPNNAGSLFRITSVRDGDQLSVSFVARRAAGPGYEGAVRQYWLEAAPDPIGPWIVVPGYSGLVGSDQTVTFKTPFAGGPRFFRGQVWLNRP